MDSSYHIKSGSMVIGIGNGLSLKTHGELYALNLDISHHLGAMVVCGEHGKCLVPSLLKRIIKLVLRIVRDDVGAVLQAL
jgi:hypothetical protein